MSLEDWKISTSSMDVFPLIEVIEGLALENATKRASVGKRGDRYPDKREALIC